MYILDEREGTHTYTLVIMENRKQAHDSLPLVSRLDHAEFIMKNLESKQNRNVMGVESDHQVPLNLAIREAYFKGTLLERVASLEHRLLQLCLALESSSTSTGTCGDASSRQESKSEISTFNNVSYQYHKQELQLLLNTSETQGKSKKGLQQRSPVKQGGKKKSNSDEKTCKSGKKRASPNWHRFNLLGC